MQIYEAVWFPIFALGNAISERAMKYRRNETNPVFRSHKFPRNSAKILMLVGNLNMILARISKILKAFVCINGAAREVEISCTSDC